MGIANMCRPVGGYVSSSGLQGPKGLLKKEKVLANVKWILAEIWFSEI